MKTEKHAMQCAGLTLIEVTLSLFVLSAGLLVLFSLFPFGLKQSEMAMDDTQEAMFADYVLGALEGNAMAITSWTEWKAAIVSPNTTVLNEGLCQSDGVVSPDVYITPASETTPTARSLEFPVGTGNRMRYTLQILDPPGYAGDDRKRMRLKVKSGRYGNFDLLGRSYITDIVYFGM